MIGSSQHDLPEARALLDLDGVGDLQQPLALALVAGVPNRGLQRRAVAHQRGSGEDEPDVFLGDPDGLGVPHHVPARIEVEHAIVALGFDFGAVGDGLAVATDPPDLVRFEHGFEREIDAVWLDLLLLDRADVVGDERAGAEHDWSWFGAGEVRFGLPRVLGSTHWRADGRSARQVSPQPTGFRTVVHADLAGFIPAR